MSLRIRAPAEENAPYKPNAPNLIRSRSNNKLRSGPIIGWRRSFYLCVSSILEHHVSRPKWLHYAGVRWEDYHFGLILTRALGGQFFHQPLRPRRASNPPAHARMRAAFFILIARARSNRKICIPRLACHLYFLPWVDIKLFMNPWPEQELGSYFTDSETAQ
jgi:hypothetical protein